jgi:hypothetical protein
MSKNLAALLIGSLLLAGYAHAGVDPVALCKEKKAKATGKKTFDLLKAFGKNIRKPNPPKLSTDISKAESKFTRAFTKAEANGNCLTSGDSEDIGALVDSFVTDTVGNISPAPSTRGERYCEILLFYLNAGELTAEVWGTQGLSSCPSESWEALDPDSIRVEYGAIAIKMNGPRYGVPDASAGFELPDAEVRTYGELGMKRLATLVLDLSGGFETFTPRTVYRTTVFEYWAGSEIYELTDPEGAVYTMISYSQIVDPELQESDLSQLADRLALPEGWSFATGTLDEDIELRADGEIVVVQDDLENTYQRR